jgi:hypothetical protein
VKRSPERKVRFRQGIAGVADPELGGISALGDMWEERTERHEILFSVNKEAKSAGWGVVCTSRVGVRKVRLPGLWASMTDNARNRQFSWLSSCRLARGKGSVISRRPDECSTRVDSEYAQMDKKIQVGLLEDT